MKAYEIVGGWAYICNNCEEDGGQPTLHWEKEDFDLCFACLLKLPLEYGDDDVKEKKDEQIIIKRQTITEEIRNKIFKRDDNKCVLCNSRNDLQIDHIVAFSRGGKTEEDNLRTLCRTCNIKKRDQL